MPAATMAVASQAVTARLTQAAIFLVAVIHPGDEAVDAVRALCSDMAGLTRGIGFRFPERHLSCVTGIGSEAWSRLYPGPRPAGLHRFRELRGERHAPSTPGDLLFHIRATHMDLCFELATQVMERIGAHVTTVDEVHGFKYFDERDLLGFVDGTENPVGAEAVAATTIGDEDAAFAGGSYVIVQKYLHDLRAWNALPVERQETIVGRRKLSDVELPASAKASYAHTVLTTIEEEGEELKILRDNMPFGDIGKGEFGTYFIGYARHPSRIERMLVNMFVGNPPGNYDRLLDVSTAVTGSLFFVPSAALLESAATRAP